jgi:GrxC family glutaredoxin
MITIYTKNNCPYCIRAKDLLNKRKLEYKEINISENPELLEDVLGKSQGMKTMPQIFIYEKHIGGCDDLYKYDEDVGFDMN